MMHNPINLRPERRPHARQIPAPRHLHLGIPYPLVDVVGQLGDLLNEGADGAEAGDCRGWGPEGHAAGANAVFFEVVTGFCAEGGEEARRCGEDGGDFGVLGG